MRVLKREYIKQKENGRRVISDKEADMLKSTVMTSAGKEHAAAGCSCEDVVLTIETESFCFYGLADGQSRKRYCTEGAAGFLRSAIRSGKDDTRRAGTCGGRTFGRYF